MRILIIKTSSMGDIIHTLPAIQDAVTILPDLRFDWLVEESFHEIPQWVQQVDRVIPLALRRWRYHPFSKATYAEWRSLRDTLNQASYDFIIDAQGLLKSAFLSYLAKGKRIGLNWQSAREPLASLVYQKKLSVDFNQHAVVRNRSLFSQALGYRYEGMPLKFGIEIANKISMPPYLVFLHGTSWHTKLWPESYWRQLCDLTYRAGFNVKMSGGNAEEIARAKKIAQGFNHVEVLSQLSITQMAELLVGSQGAVSVDTGFGHLAAALEIPTISLYGATDAALTGAIGKTSVHLQSQFACSPCLNKKCHFAKPTVVTPACFAELTPEKVWQQIEKMI